MAGLELLVPLIYHERQQPGSMLCAQHALNSLMQGNYFTAPDLAAIAQSLDALEASYDEANNGRQSTNMDDTGFFSVQVLEEALKVWGLRLVRWRSEDMLAFQEKPHTQLAFILNLELHWFTLRRFGPAQSDPYDDPGEGHWFNLNSFLERPEWISRTYLGMVLQQAEQEGYSVFSVCELDPSGELTLARTEADEHAGTLPQPTSSGTGRLNTARVAQARSATGAQSSTAAAVAGAEDEDMLLQAALQASLMGDAGFGEGDAPSWLRDQDFSYSARPPQESLAAGRFNPPAVPDNDDDDMDADDPVAASIARSRALLDRMRRDQDMAMRGALDDDIMHHIQRAQASSNMPDATRTGTAEPLAPAARTRGDDEEDALLQQALAASQEHIVYDSPRRQNRSADLPRADEEDDDFEMDAGSRPHPPAAVSAAGTSSHVVYDDEDAELQAALRASLAGLPEGFMLPPSPGPPPMPALVNALPPAQPPAASTPGATDDDEHDAPAQEPSPEELRRKRLARFA